MFIIGIISGESITYRDTSLLVFILMILTVFGVIGQTFILLLGNRDKGMMASMGLIMLAVWGFAYSARNNDTDMDGFDAFMNAAETLLPYSPLILAGLFALLFAALYFIYRRREK